MGLLITFMNGSGNQLNLSLEFILTVHTIVLLQIVLFTSASTSTTTQFNIMIICIYFCRVCIMCKCTPTDVFVILKVGFNLKGS